MDRGASKPWKVGATEHHDMGARWGHKIPWEATKPDQLTPIVWLIQQYSCLLQFFLWCIPESAGVGTESMVSTTMEDDIGKLRGVKFQDGAAPKLEVLLFSTPALWEKLWFVYWVKISHKPPIIRAAQQTPWGGRLRRGLAENPSGPILKRYDYDYHKTGWWWRAAEVDTHKIGPQNQQVKWRRHSI